MTAIPNSQDRLSTVSSVPPSKSVKKSALRWGSLAVWGLLILTAGIAVFSFVQASAWRAQPFLGAMYSRALVIDGTRPLGGYWEGLAAGLQRGDQLVAVAGQPLRAADSSDAAAQAELSRILSAQTVGSTVEVRFIRVTSADSSGGAGVNCTPLGGDQWLCSTQVQLAELPNNDFVALFVIPFIAGVLCLGSGVVVLSLRGQYLSARLSALVCGLLALFSFGLFDLNTTHVLVPLWLITTAALGGAVISLALCFPGKLGVLYRTPRLLYVPFAAAALAAAIALFLQFAAVGPGNPTVGIQIALFMAIGGAFTACMLWIRQRQRAISPLMRDQASLILVGFLFALIPGVIWFINVLIRAVAGTDGIPFNTSAIAPFFTLPAFSMAYSVLQTRTIDADRWISRGITYTFLALGLLLGYFLLVLSVTFVTGRYVEANNPALIALATFLVAVLFVPVRMRLQTMIDRLYFRQRINYQNEIEIFAGQLSALRELPAISAEYRATLERTIAPTHTFIFLPAAQTGEYVAFGRPKPETDIRFVASSPIVQYLREREGLVSLDADTPWASELVAERARLLVLKPLVIAGFRGSSRLSGFAVIGPPRSEAGVYNYDEQRFIENLTNQMTVAVERAQVVDSLERRVRELDILSRVSQAVNFTGDFDQLLELISTQTMKLIEATHVYIVLRDTTSNELYYAFFLENGERYEDKETLRWTVGSDLMSEVVRSGQALRVPQFARAMSERGVLTPHEDSALTAWMGVPLITGARVLGVLAVGNAEPHRPFSDDQLRLLLDVGALAATSLDKARLFAETNLRARQLAALNEVSRKLVATELNLDNLLNLITTSATDILNAEAGSLLLTAEDGSGDLEFKVDVGSPGSHLVGLRLPAGKGLAGEVARSGRLIVVNDAQSDPRWAGEQTSGGFVTRNILAVPLITQNRIIGVLEVLNRRAGVFSGEDADLLSTFAGQAAVAIENARLFQMTDLQLRDRLEELETLEQIDAEMNRSLDLSVVAEIALRWALDNTEATAGVIGLVSGEPPRLYIAASIGYEEADQPEGAENGSWPLDRGIASRSLRTLRAELVADVKLDPLYVPSLRGARSQITVPMLSGGDVIALLILESNQEGKLRLADMPFVQRLAEHASIAIANAQLYQQLVRANAGKSEFVGFVAHELKNPLTSIKGFADLLIAGAVGTLSDPQRNALSTIRSNAERMNTLVSDLNDVTKLQTNNLRIELLPVSFAEVVDETLRPLQKQIEDKGQQVVRDIPEDLPLIHADRNRMIQVLTNLVSNAYKYSPADARIHISATVRPPQRDAKGQMTRPAIHVRVQDEGIGMAPEDLAKLFTPYFRSENPAAREQPGTGLGLTITRGIVERHSGEIWVESELGYGTTFHFTVPLAEQVSEQA